MAISSFCGILYYWKGFLNSKVLSVQTRGPEFRDSASKSKAERGNTSLQFPHWGAGDRKILEVCWSATEAGTVSARPSERACLQKFGHYWTRYLKLIFGVWLSAYLCLAACDSGLWVGHIWINSKLHSLKEKIVSKHWTLQWGVLPLQSRTAWGICSARPLIPSLDGLAFHVNLEREQSYTKFFAAVMIIIFSPPENTTQWLRLPSFFPSFCS